MNGATRVLRFLATVPVVVISLCIPARGQQSSCTPVSVEANVILPDGRLIRGLQRDGLVAESKAGSVHIESVTRDIGPRRILFVLDGGRDLSRDAIKAQTEIVSYIVQGANTPDTFAFTVARGNHATVRFDEGRENLLAALPRLEDSANSPSDNEGSLDAVMEAVDWFGAAQPGDAVVLMSLDIEKNKHATYPQIARILSDRHIRLFGLALGPINVGTVYSEIGGDYRGRPIAHSDVVFNDQTLSGLSWNSGGYLLVENTKMPWKEYKLTDARLEELKNEASQLYGVISEFYRVAIVPPPHAKEHEYWKLDLSESLRKRVPQAKVLYPRDLPPCLPAVAR